MWPFIVMDVIKLKSTEGSISTAREAMNTTRPMPLQRHSPNQRICQRETVSSANQGRWNRKDGNMPSINLPYGNNSFDSNSLKEHIRTTSRNYIIQGQKACRRIDHRKPSSLDCWLRDNCARNPDTKQAVNEVIADLVNTGDFTEGDFYCPDSGRRCKRVRIIEASESLHRIADKSGSRWALRWVCRKSHFS